jgi:hypothetical protein
VLAQQKVSCLYHLGRYADAIKEIENYAIIIESLN